MGYYKDTTMSEEKKNDSVNLSKRKNLLSLLSTFYVKFYLLETILKTQLIQNLEAKYSANWLEELVEKVKLFSDESDIISKRKKKGLKLNTKLFIHEASFGFWIELFGREPYKQLKGLPIKAFNDLPKEIRRRDLYRMLTHIKEIRNKLYHHRINLSTQLQDKQINALIQADKDLVFIIQILDKSALSLFDVTQFEKTLKILSRG